MPINERSVEWQKVLTCRVYINDTEKKNLSQDSVEWKDAIKSCLMHIVDVCDCRYEYAFTRSITEFIGKFGDSVKELLEELLEKESASDKDMLFAAYYGLSILFKDDFKLECLSELVEKHSNRFKDYLLSYEVLARLEKRKVNVGEKATNRIKLNKALDYDAKAIALIAEQFSARNSGVEISYVSTICRMLELKIDVSQKDIETAREYAEFAIEQYGDYAKYYYSLGKLFVALAELSDDRETIVKHIDRAKENFGQAINRENHDFYHHNSRISKYNAELNNAEIVLFKKLLQSEMKSVEKSVGDFNNKCVDIETQVDEKINKNKKQTIELLAIFTAILQIIIGVINFSSAQTNLINLIITIIVLNCSTLGVYAAYLKMTADKSSETAKRSGYVLILIGIILIACIFAAYKYF